MAVKRRNWKLRHRIAVVLADGEWKSAQEIAHHFLEEGWGFGSIRQIASICSRTPGFSARNPGMKPNNQYRLHNPKAFHEWMERKRTGDMITTQYEG